MRFIQQFLALVLFSANAFALSPAVPVIPAEFRGRWSPTKNALGKAYSVKEQALQCRSKDPFRDVDTDIYPLDVSASTITFASFVAGYKIRVIQITASTPDEIQGIGNIEEWEEGVADTPPMRQTDFRLKRSANTLVHTIGKDTRFYFTRCK